MLLFAVLCSQSFSIVDFVHRAVSGHFLSCDFVAYDAVLMCLATLLKMRIMQFTKKSKRLFESSGYSSNEMTRFAVNSLLGAGRICWKLQTLWPNTLYIAQFLISNLKHSLP
jgi:hypothetical protein